MTGDEPRDTPQDSDEPEQRTDTEDTGAPRGTVESSVSFRVTEGAIEAAHAESEASVRASISSVGFGSDHPGEVKLTYGGSMDPQFGSGTGFELRIPRVEFYALMLAADQEWDDVECTIDSLEMGGGDGDE